MSGHPPTSPEEVRAFFDDWIGASNAGAWDRVEAMMHPDIELVDPMLEEPARGRPAALARARGQYEPFPDGVVTMLGAPFVSVGDPEVAYRWRFTGTHERTIDPPGFAPTGERVSVDGTSVLRFAGGQVVRVELFFDTTAVARQLLAAPPAGHPMERAIALSQRTRVALRRLRGR